MELDTAVIKVLITVKSMAIINIPFPYQNSTTTAGKGQQKKEVNPVTEQQKKFLEAINEAMPRMTELEQEKLLAFGEGLAFMTREREIAQSGASA